MRPALVPCVVLCLLGTVVGQTWRQLSPPAARAHCAMAYDTARGVTVMFGGTGAAGALGDTWELDGASWRHVGSYSPGPALGSAMAFDAARGRVVMVPGTTPGQGYNTWELDAGGWRGVPGMATAPSSRAYHGLAFDAARSRIVLFGGQGVGVLNDTWTYDGTAWTLVVAALSPPARAGHAMTYDSVRQRVVVFGGRDVRGAVLGDTWEFDGASWTERTPTAVPPARAFAAAAYDGRVVVFGGKDAQGQPLGDAWEYDGTTWFQRTPTTVPPPCSGHGLVYDPDRGRLVLFGGLGANGLLDRTWEYGRGAWFEIPRPAAPSAREGHQLAFDARRGKLVLFGGMDSAYAPLGDTWEFDGVAWTHSAASPAPSARGSHALTYDARRGRVVLFGGITATGAVGDTWEYDGSGWTPVVTSVAPSPRFNHALAYDLVRGRVVLFGGHSGGAPLGDTWEYDGSNWTWIATPTAPAAREDHALAYDARRGRVMLFGGSGFFGTLAPLGDTWEFDGCNWVQVATSGPSARLQLAMTYDPLLGRLLAFGGYVDPATYFGDTWSYSTQSFTPSWQQELVAYTPAPASPAPRAAAAIAPFHPLLGVVLFGGRSPQGVVGDTWLLWSWGFGASYGAGCPGSGGVPSLSSDWSFQYGYRVDLRNLPVAPGAALLLTGFGIGSLGGLPLPMDLGWLGLPGCDLWVAFDPAIPIWIPHTGLSASMTLPLPNTPVLRGLFVANQCLSIDPGASGGLGAMSNACLGTIN